MAKISNTLSYPNQLPIESGDYLIGTAANSTPIEKQTKTFTLGDIANFIIDGAFDGVSYRLPVFTAPTAGEESFTLVNSLLYQDTASDGQKPAEVGGTTVYVDNGSGQGNLFVAGDTTTNGLLTVDGGIYLNSEVYDAFNNVGTGEQVLVSQADGTVQWQNYQGSGLEFQGAWDADINIPDLTAIPLIPDNTGKYWIVSVAGGTNLPTQGGGSIYDWEVGDWAIISEDLNNNIFWDKIDNSSVLTGGGTTDRIAIWTSPTELGDANILKGTGNNSLVFNDMTTPDATQGTYASAFGLGTQADGDYALATGQDTRAFGESSFATGFDNEANGPASAAFGSNTFADGQQAFAIGSNTSALAENSFAAGVQTNANGANSFVGGNGSNANGQNAFSFGGQTQADGSHAVSMGASSNADGDFSVVLGQGNNALANHGVAIGYANTVTATGGYSIAMGFESTASGATSVAIGNNAVASGDNSAAIGGENTTASGDYSFAVGEGTTATGTNSTALGGGTIAGGPHSVAIGKGTQASGNSSTAMGGVTLASGFASTAMGADTIASGDYALATGEGTTASGAGSTAMGSVTTASGLTSTALGDTSTASGLTATALGNNAEASGNYSVAIGQNVIASGTISLAMGNGSDATGTVAVAIGNRATASGVASLALGEDTTAIGFASTAMGKSTNAQGDYSTAMGVNSTATGLNSTAIGGSATASGLACVAIGDGVVASGSGAQAFGTDAEASGDNSVAFGTFSTSTASGDGSVTIGEGNESRAVGSYTMGAFNVIDGVSSFAVGKGNQINVTAAQAFSTGKANLSSGDESHAIGTQLNATDFRQIVIGSNNVPLPGSVNTWTNTHNLLTVGNGVDAANQSNALEITKGGLFKLPSYGSGTITGVPANSLSVDAGGNVIETPIVSNTFIINGMVNNLGSQASGHDFMEWTSNVTGDTQIPLFRNPVKLQLEKVTWAWMGETALSVPVTASVDFSIGTIPNNTNPIHANYTSVSNIFSIDNTDDGTWAYGEASFAAGAIVIDKFSNIGVVGVETGAVTPNNGELSISFFFREV